MTMGEKGRDKPKVSPQVSNLPSPQPNKHPHRPERKPLNPLVGTLIGIPQLLLSRTQVLHLIHDLGDKLFNAAQFSLNGLKFLLRLDAGPVASVGADVDVQFDGTVGVGDGVCIIYQYTCSRV